MSVYRNLGRRTDVEETYRRCRENLAAHLAIAPAPETEALLETLAQDAAGLRGGLESEHDPSC
jgi:DNA-binding SARP family transcriptional activator